MERAPRGTPDETRWETPGGAMRVTHLCAAEQAKDDAIVTRGATESRGMRVEQ